MGATRPRRGTPQLGRRLSATAASQLMVSRRAWLWLAPATLAAIVALAGCGSDSASPSSSTTGRASTNNSGDACLVGQWNVDLQTLGPQATSLIKGLTDPQMSGSVGVTFTATTVTAKYAARLQAQQQPAGKPASAIVVEMNGTTRSDYTANGTTIAVSKASGAVKAKQTTTVAGKSRTTDATELFSPITDFTSESVAYSCTGNSLRLSNMAGFSMSASRQA